MTASGQPPSPAYTLQVFARMTPSPDLGEMERLRNILQFEALFGGFQDLQGQDRVNAFLNARSQYDILRYIFSRNEVLGNALITEHMQKHPHAIQSQQVLFQTQPGLLPFILQISLDKDHPLRTLEEYQKVVVLLNNLYPKNTTSEQIVTEWAHELDVALVRFMDCSLICAIFADEKMSRENTAKIQVRLDPKQFTVDFLALPELMKDFKKQLARVGQRTSAMRTIGNIRVHGNVTEDDSLIVELVKTYMYFLERKITIMSHVVLHPTFVIGLLNFSSKLTENSDLHISFAYDGDQSLNTADIGIDFNHLIPIVCNNPQCHANFKCHSIPNEKSSLFTQVGSVELGKPPVGAQKTVNFKAMEATWGRRAESAGFMADPLKKPMKRKYRKRRGTLDAGKKMVWENKYLRHVCREYEKMAEEDRHMMNAHPANAPDANIYQMASVPQLFMPHIFQGL